MEPALQKIFEEVDYMSGDFFLDTADVLRYLNESSALFGDEDGSTSHRHRCCYASSSHV